MATAIKFLIEEFHNLSAMFDECQVTFCRRCYDPDNFATKFYTIALSGVGVEHGVGFHDSDDWEAVLESIYNKSPIRTIDTENY